MFSSPNTATAILTQHARPCSIPALSHQVTSGAVGIKDAGDKSVFLCSSCVLFQMPRDRADITYFGREVLEAAHQQNIIFIPQRLMFFQVCFGQF